MNSLKITISTVFILFFVFSFGITFVSCSKTNTVHDTTYHVVKDTITIKDTVYDLKDGLVAYYNFLNGNLKDSSGHSNNIVFNNASMAPDRFGNPNSSYRFASGSYMRVVNDISLSPTNITLMAVVKFNGYYAGLAWGNQIFMKGPSDPFQGVYGLRAHPTGFDYMQPIDTSTEMFTPYYGDGAPGVSDPNDLIVSGTWYTIVYTYDGNQGCLYINGALKKSQTFSVGFHPNTNDLYIGKTENVSFPYYFTGDIDEIRIYNKALSAQLVKQFSNLKY